MMIKRLSIILMAVFFILNFGWKFIIPVHAQGNTKIILSADKTQYNPGDTVKVTIQGQNVIDMFGLQFTLHYDPSILEMQGEDMSLQGDYTVFGGKSVDKSKGLLTYPLINQKPGKEKKDTDTVGYITFKALKKGPVILKLDNIKAVDSNSNEINYNTQTQAVFNILEKQAVSPAPGNGSNSAINTNLTKSSPGAGASNRNNYNIQITVIISLVTIIAGSFFYFMKRQQLRR